MQICARRRGIRISMGAHIKVARTLGTVLRLAPEAQILAHDVN
jgi:hypothetical protein